MANKIDCLTDLFLNEQILNQNAKEELAILLELKPEEIFDFIKANQFSIRHIDANNIPQFSNVFDVLKVLKIVDGSPEKKLTWEKLGYYLCPKGAKPGAKTKYGENHYKLAVQLGLANPGRFLSLTPLGKEINVLNDEEKNHLISLLSMRIPIIQVAFVNAESKEFNIFKFLQQYLSDTTIRRRRSNIKTLIKMIDALSSTPEMHMTILGIVWREQ